MEEHINTKKENKTKWFAAALISISVLITSSCANQFDSQRDWQAYKKAEKDCISMTFAGACFRYSSTNRPLAFKAKGRVVRISTAFHHAVINVGGDDFYCFVEDGPWREMQRDANISSNIEFLCVIQNTIDDKLIRRLPTTLTESLRNYEGQPIIHVYQLVPIAPK